jgi:hypothetical protein
VKIFALGEIPQQRGAVIGNRRYPETYFLVRLLLPSQLDELSFAEGSPVG